MAQDGQGGANGIVGWLPEREGHFRERFAELLFPGSKRDLVAGWQHAINLGRPAVPLLWEMLRSEQADYGRRLVTLAAAMLAGGPGEDARVFAWLAQQKPMLEERVLASMVLALGPQRQRPQAEFWSRCFGPAKTPELLLQVAARLASARFPEAAADAPAFIGDDPGIAAASAFAGLSVPQSVAAKWGNGRSSERHAELYWRGAMLGAARRWRVGEPQQDAVLDLAREVMAGKGDAVADSRAAATWLSARAGVLRPDGQQFDLRLLAIAVADSACAQRFAAKLAAAPQPRDEEPHRLAVAYALTQPIRRVIEERAAWSGEARISSHVALALAWRLLGTALTEPIQVSLPNVPEWAFVRWATGAAWETPGRFDDEGLQMVAQLCSEGRIGRAALREKVEQMLWLRGSHPGLEPWQQERRLVRDLLLTGSNWGGGKYQPRVRLDLRYLPTGLGRDDAFFEIAVALYDFLLVPRLPIPVEHRLGS